MQEDDRDGVLWRKKGLACPRSSHPKAFSVVEGLEFVTGRGVGRSRDVKGPSAPYVYL